MKRIPAFLLTLVTCWVSMYAYDFTYNGIRYDIVSSSSKTVEVAASTQSAGSDGSVPYSGAVTIPETVKYSGSSYTVVGIGQSAFVNCAGVTSVKLPSTLTYIRKEAFNVCISLEEIEIPANVTSIGYDVFGVTSVKKITVKGKTPASADYNAFQYVQNNNNCVLYVPSGAKSAYSSASEWKKFKTIIENGPEPGMLDGHEYVDLGLPSGRLWATMNYGATSASGYGSYLEWWECSNISASWGSNWRTPSRTEASELVNSCSWSWGSKNGVSGYTVTGPNGNSMFMPASGFKMNMGGGAQSLGQQLYYWTTTSGNSGFAYALNGNSSSVNTNTTWNTEIMMCSVRPCADKIEETIKVTSISLNAQTISLTEGDSYTLTATVAPSNATDKSLTWSSSNTSVAMVNNSVVKAISQGTATITAKANDGSNVSASCQITVKKAEPPVEPTNGVLRLWYNGTYQEISTNQLDSITFAIGNYDNGQEYVDLGLPSGLKWATCNVGANAPEESGDFFAWGETEAYNEGTYKWYMYYGSKQKITKYCTDSQKGTVDNKTILEEEDDAAHVNWGGSWRMPTNTELDELREKCSWIWASQNGVNGYKVKGPNGNTIFLPAAGYPYYGNITDVGSYGGYWSSSLDEILNSFAYSLSFESDSYSCPSALRNSGRVVRPVRQ